MERLFSYLMGRIFRNKLWSYNWKGCHYRVDWSRCKINKTANKNDTVQ